VADLAIEAARDALAEAQAVATHPMFQGKAVPLDVTREESVRNIFNEMVSAFGRIDYCINCAGVSLMLDLSMRITALLTRSALFQIGAQQTTDIASLSLAEFQRFLDLNTTGMFLVTREASIAMRAQEPRSVSASEPARGLSRGTIVNLASASSLVATTGVLPYTTSKHAVLGLTKNSGKHSAKLVKKGVRYADMAA
jgi:NAD(P)-dependent dehydrogenase (short-subunit alcohol dehydrogenase family)